MWDSRRQNVVARSTLEAEPISMSDAMAAAMFMKSFATQTGHDIEITGFAENKASLTTANRADATSRATRHIRADHFYIREKVADGSVTDTRHQIADALTKPLSSAPLTKKYNKVLFGGLDPDKPPHESIVIESASTYGREGVLSGALYRLSGVPCMPHFFTIKTHTSCG
ncbi:Importin beta-related nuclear transport receptor [Ceratocystis lukuohia]|uniref:Importin beta-related nuclear transport receptor n=1 Tax=Ceratocystis lukuohia TaxID=2019550 RepID=A0ABR4MBA0_9PEZI